jgi:cation transport ATPase
MLNSSPVDTSTNQHENITESTIEQAKTQVTQPSWPRRIRLAIRSYPIPISALALLLVSFALWLARRTELANWTLLVIVLMGGIPLLWDTLKHSIHKEFSVDFIAILAITGSLLLQEYLAGAFIVLMLSGGEALEAFALRRARTSLSALAERAPRTAHIWQGDQLISIPVDGIVTSGSSSISEADLTGEPIPVRNISWRTQLSKPR